MENYNHIFAYDVSGSTFYCTVETESGRKVPYYEYLRYDLHKKIQSKYSVSNFTYVSWDTGAEIETSFVKKAGGGTNPTKAFSLILTKFYSTPNYIHFITDGDIGGFDYQKIEMLKETDRIDIYFVGNNNHNIAFYQRVKEIMKSRCKVIVNDKEIEMLEENEDGEITISDDEQWEILRHNYDQSEKECEPFNKLLSTIVTYSQNNNYKNQLRNIIGQLIKKSKGNLKNEYLRDNVSMKEIQEIVKSHMQAVSPTFTRVVFKLLNLIENQNLNSGMLNGKLFIRTLNSEKVLISQQLNYLNEVEEKDEAMECEKKTQDCNYKMEVDDRGLEDALKCVVTLEFISGPFVLEASFDDDQRFCHSLESNFNQIRQCPWLLMKYISNKQFCETVNVITTPYLIEPFFAINENASRAENIFGSIFKFTKISYVLFHKNMKITENYLKILINLNYVSACNLFFNQDSGESQVSVGKKFEIVYVYLYFLLDMFKTKKMSQILIEDVEFTLQAIAENKKNLCKLPQFGIFYSVKLFKRILSESKIFDKVSSPITAFTIRQRLNLDSRINADSKISFIGCLQWLHSGKTVDIFEVHDFLNDKIFVNIMGFKRPSDRKDFTFILRFLISPFFKHFWHKNNLILINELVPEKEFYFNGVDRNFLNFLILSLNHPFLPINGTDIKFEKRNIDMKLFSSYNSKVDYKVDFEKLLYVVKISENFRDVQICLNTLRPRVSYENGKFWTDFCENLDKTLTHNDRLEKCDSLHTSNFKHYIKFIYKRLRVPSFDEFVDHLIQKYPFKLFENEILCDISDVIKNYEKILTFYCFDFQTIKKKLKRSLKMADRISLEQQCEIEECFHYNFKRPKIFSSRSI